MQPDPIEQPDGGDPDGRQGESEKHEHENHIVTALVNEHPVKLLGHAESGARIKTAAIEQNVKIQLDFVLEEEVPDGATRIVQDHEHVQLREGQRFTAHHKNHDVTVSLNEQPVKLHGRTATGAQIKAMAIEQGVLIQPNFVLQEELPNGTSKIVGDNDKIHLREHLRFTAIAPDDNS